jgi:hypothetical protein
MILIQIGLCQNHDENGINRCAVKDRTPTEFFAAEAHRTATLKNVTEITLGGNIGVYFHSIVNTRGDGAVDQLQFDSQLRILNNALKSGGWTFTLKSVDVSRNDTWFNMSPGNIGEKDAKTVLREGGANDLNFYTANLANNVLGWASYPTDYEHVPYMDGVVIQFSTMPGGSTVNYNEGKNAIHQVGHWMGLYHTYQGGCSVKSGSDGIDDTPLSRAANYGCPGEIDTCPDQPGSDPTNNYMDVGYDSCMNTFTPGQFTRMSQEFSAYRGGKYTKAHMMYHNVTLGQ